MRSRPTRPRTGTHARRGELAAGKAPRLSSSARHLPSALPWGCTQAQRRQRAFGRRAQWSAPCPSRRVLRPGGTGRRAGHGSSRADKTSAPRCSATSAAVNGAATPVGTSDVRASPASNTLPSTRTTTMPYRFGENARQRRNGIGDLAGLIGGVPLVGLCQRRSGSRRHVAPSGRGPVPGAGENAERRAPVRRQYAAARRGRRRTKAGRVTSHAPGFGHI